MRRFVLTATLLLTFAACHKNDNASPFAQGAKNDPSHGGSTKVKGGQGSNGGTQTADSSTTAQYGASSGAPGGYRPDAQGGSSTSSTTSAASSSTQH